MFDRMTHADWSISSSKRWAASARRQQGTWSVSRPVAIPDTSTFLNDAFRAGERERVLLGFDFPIGVPTAYGVHTGSANFRELLPALGHGTWNAFFDVNDRSEDISVYRPFYPRVSRKGVSPASLVSGLRIASSAELLRTCERRTDTRQAACSLFWTLGGNQVGKAAIAGWQQIVRPALARGSRLWPFEGSLARLASEPGVVLAETYPAEAYGMIDARFLPGESKRRQHDRAARATAITTWAAQHNVLLSPELRADVADGFGSEAGGEDRFDALLGLLGMIEVAEGRRPEMTERHAATVTWEGWILGR
jgi:hypothetical protein